MRLGWRPGNETGEGRPGNETGMEVCVGMLLWSGDMGMRLHGVEARIKLGWRPGNTTSKA